MSFRHTNSHVSCRPLHDITAIVMLHHNVHGYLHASLLVAPQLCTTLWKHDWGSGGAKTRQSLNLSQSVEIPRIMPSGVSLNDLRPRCGSLPFDLACQRVSRSASQRSYCLTSDPFCWPISWNYLFLAASTSGRWASATLSFNRTRVSRLGEHLTG